MVYETFEISDSVHLNSTWVDLTYEMRSNPFKLRLSRSHKIFQHVLQFIVTVYWIACHLRLCVRLRAELVSAMCVDHRKLLPAGEMPRFDAMPLPRYWPRGCVSGQVIYHGRVSCCHLALVISLRSRPLNISANCPWSGDRQDLGEFGRIRAILTDPTAQLTML